MPRLTIDDLKKMRDADRRSDRPARRDGPGQGDGPHGHLRHRRRRARGHGGAARGDREAGRDRRHR
ncbi:MAG: hypothetical protein MZV70_15850 [Desulfobacterales bacterium]|nr:hypothetical protein [Desulfobacterales bacterium]